MEWRIGDHRVVGRHAVAEAGGVGPVEAGARVGDVGAGGVERCGLGLVEVELGDAGRLLQRRLGEPAPAGAEVGDPAGDPAVECCGEAAAARVRVIGGEHPRGGQIAVGVRARLGVARPGRDCDGQGLGPGQPEDPAVRLDEGAVERDLPGHRPRQAVDAVALGAGDHQGAAGRQDVEGAGEVAEVLGAAAGEVDHDHRRRPLGAGRDGVASFGQRVVDRAEALRAAQPVGGHQIQEGGGHRPEDEDIAFGREGERLRLERERQTIDLGHKRARGAVPTPFPSCTAAGAGCDGRSPSPG